MAPIVGDIHEEQAHLLLLNQNFKLIKHLMISRGGLTETLMDVRVIMRHAVLNNATQIVLTHNHPSQNPKPSKMDEEITKAIDRAGQVMRIRLADHVIICSEGYWSFRENGKI